MTLILNGTSGITDVNGTAAAPAITGTDTDTGVFFGTNTVSLSTGGTERLQVDASGNAGLGVTPTNNTLGKTLQVGQAGAWVAESGTNRWWLANNWYYNSGDKYINNGYATLYSQQNGSHQWQIAASGTAGNAISFTQAMTLDSGGRLQLGTTSLTGGLLNFGNTASTTSIAHTWADTVYSTYMGFDSTYYMGTMYNAAGREVRLVANSNDSNGKITFYTGGSGTPSERARIDSNGNLLVGTTSPIQTLVGIQLNGSGAVSTQYSKTFINGVYGDTYALPQFVGNQAGTYYWGFGNDSGTANANTLRLGTVSVNSSGWFFAGGYFNLKGGAYTNASDYRLKRNVETFSDSVIEKIKLTRPVSYKQIVRDEDDELVDCRTEVGFLAHELQELFPEFVIGQKDAVDAAGNIDAQGVDYAKFTAVLVKAIQEQQAIIEQLQADVAALKGQA